MLCRLCEQQKKLIKAHIIPEGFFRRLREGNKAPLLVSERDYVKRSPIGIYDSGILCANCDGIFALWDDYAQQILSPDLGDAQKIMAGATLLGWSLNSY